MILFLFNYSDFFVITKPNRNYSLVQVNIRTLLKERLIESICRIVLVYLLLTSNEYSMYLMVPISVDIEGSPTHIGKLSDYVGCGHKRKLYPFAVFM